MIRRVEEIRHDTPQSSLPIIKEHLRTIGITLSQYYRREKYYMSTDAYKLVKKEKEYEPEHFCLLARDFARYKFGLPNHNFENEILKELIAESVKLKKTVCQKCPYNPESRRRGMAQ